MEKTSTKLTIRERRYVKRQVSSINYVYLLLWLIYLILFVGIALTFLAPELNVGYLILVFGFIFLIPMKLIIYYEQLDLLDNVFEHTGSLRIVHMRKSHFLYVDNYKLFTPDIFYFYIDEITKENKRKKITLLLAAYKFKTKEKDDVFYVPTRIGNDFCIDQTLKRYGRFFLAFETIKFIIIGLAIPFVFVALLMAPFMITREVVIQSDIISVVFETSVFLLFGLLIWKAFAIDVFNTNKLKKKLSCRDRNKEH